MPSHPPSAPDLAARIIDYQDRTTALHQAAKEGTLQNLSGVTAELLATVKDNHGVTPLHYAASYGHLDQIPGVTAELLATVKKRLRPNPTPRRRRAGPIRTGPFFIQPARERARVAPHHHAFPRGTSVSRSLAKPATTTTSRSTNRAKQSNDLFCRTKRKPSHCRDKANTAAPVRVTYGRRARCARH